MFENKDDVDQMTIILVRQFFLFLLRLNATIQLSIFFAFVDYLQYPVSASSIYAALPAVITVNMIIAAYVYVAWHSEPWSDQPPAPVITTQPVARTDKKKD